MAERRTGDCAAPYAGACMMSLLFFQRSRLLEDESRDGYPTLYLEETGEGRRFRCGGRGAGGWWR